MTLPHPQNAEERIPMSKKTHRHVDSELGGKRPDMYSVAESCREAADEGDGSRRSGQSPRRPSQSSTSSMREVSTEAQNTHGRRSQAQSTPASIPSEGPNSRRQDADAWFPKACIIGEALGNMNQNSIGDEAMVDLDYVNKSSDICKSDPPSPSIPVHFDGLVIGRFVGNLNCGRICDKARVKMRYTHQHAATTDKPASSSSSREQQYSQGFYKISSNTPQTVTSTFPAMDGPGQKLGQSPAGRYPQSQASL